MKRKKSKRKKNQLNGTSSQEIIIDLPAEKVRLNEITLQSKEKKIHNHKSRILGPCEDQIWMALITTTINI